MVKDNNISNEDLNQDGLETQSKPEKGNIEDGNVEELPEVIEKKEFDETLKDIDQKEESVDDFSMLAAEVSKEVADEVLKRVDESEKNPAPKPVLDNDVVNSLDETADSESKLDGFLMDIGITRKQFFIFIGIILFFIAGVVLSFIFLVSLFTDDPNNIDFKDNTPEEPVVIEEPVEEVKSGPGFFERLFGGSDEPSDQDPIEEKPVIVEEDNNDDVTSGIDVSNEIGRDRPVKISYESIEVLNIVGSLERSENKLSDYIRVYRELRTVFNTDLYAYLAVVPDRELAFDEYLLKLKGTFQKFQLSKAELEQEIAELKLRNQSTEQNLERIEALFFAEVEALNSESVPNLLSSFQEAARTNVIVTSELKARQAVLDRFNNADGIVVDKITAIELNKDAFVKNVQVIDYRNIDLDLVVDQS